MNSSNFDVFCGWSGKFKGIFNLVLEIFGIQVFEAIPLLFLGHDVFSWSMIYDVFGRFYVAETCKNCGLMA